MTYAGTTCDPHLRVNNLIETAPFLFKYAPKDSPTSIRRQYCHYHTLETLPSPTTVTVAREYGSQAELLQAQHAAATAALQPENIGLKMFQLAAEAILLTPTCSFLDQYEKIQREIALKKLSTEIVDGKTTKDTAMELDAEGAASHELLRNLIRKESQKQNKKYDDLQQKYQNLQKELKESQKNGNQRGRQQSGASENKKKSANRSGKNGTQNSQGRSRSGSHSHNRSRSNTRRQMSCQNDREKAPDGGSGNDNSGNDKSGRRNNNRNNNRGSGRQPRLKKKTFNTGRNKQRRA